jgi:hypothetical protein
MRNIEDFQVITRNAAVCLVCHDLVESKHGRDFRKCSCGNLFVDGGKNYIRRGYTTPGMHAEMNEFRNMTREELQAKIDRLEISFVDYGADYFREYAEYGKELMKEWYGVTHVS